jgi:hypothetical protein
MDSLKDNDQTIPKNKDILQDSLTNDTINLKTQKAPATSVTFLSGFSIDGFVGFNKNGQILSTDDPEIDIDYFKENEVSPVLLTYGANINYEVKDKWLLGVGFNVSSWERVFDGDLKVNVILEEDEMAFLSSHGDVVTNFEAIEVAIEDHIEENFEEDDDDIPDDYEFEINTDVELLHSFQYVNIPLSAAYQWRIKSLNLLLGTSIYGRFLINSNFEGNISTQFESNDFEDLEMLEIEDKIFGISLFTQIEKDLNSRLSVYAKPEFEFDLKSSTYLSVLNNRHTNLGLRFGLKYKL